MKKRFIQRLFDRFVFEHTKKPSHYIRVDNPKTLQDLRQIRFNRWCRRFGVFCGSYLPENPNDLTKKGWKDMTSPKDTTGKHKEYQRKSTGQLVRYDEKEFKKGRWEDEHYHWKNAYSLKELRRLKNKNMYIDRYGNVCQKDSPPSHLAPKDRKYNFRK